MRSKLKTVPPARFQRSGDAPRVASLVAEYDCERPHVFLMTMSFSLTISARRFASTLLLAAAVAACSGATPTPSPIEQVVLHGPKKEVVADFGALVPRTETTAPQYQDVPLERVTSAVPWSRGFAQADGELYVLSRGRHRSDGGVSRDLDDQAGTLWRVDTTVSEPVVPGRDAGEAVRTNAQVLARPTSPPFHLYDYGVAPEEDVLMGRPYCALAYDPASRNFFVCAYSGAELETGFRKHATDAIYRYDLRDGRWYVVEQHDPDSVPAEALGAVVSNEYYPHHDPATNPPPHGWPNGPDGCAVVGDFLYVPSKDNHLVTQYDLAPIRADPSAAPPQSRPVLGPRILLSHPGGKQEMEVLGTCAVAATKDHLYVSSRTSSIVYRVPLKSNGDLARGRDGRIEAELIAVFQPWDTEAKTTGNMYDITLSPEGELFVSMGYAGRVWRIQPDPERPFYGNDQTERPTSAAPFVDMSVELGRKAGCNNVFAAEDGYLYISSRTNDTGGGEFRGTIYRVRYGPPQS